ncbi:uncharacterized protein [Euphorbia lathyris]|uniref:uncharacterized protein n=1 Tax=Euphorbia lathyris TaxID=212925 RepID=UPI0033138C36
MSHHETNPHFIRPLQQRDGQHSPPTPAVEQQGELPHEPQNQQNQPPLPRQGQRSKPKGPRGGTYEGDGPFRAPRKGSEPRQPQYPQTDPSDPRHDAEYHTPWLIPLQHPTPKEEHQVEDPKRDGKFRSPWMVLPQHQDEGLQEPRLTRKKPQRLQQPDGALVTQPQHHDLEQDHYPLHLRDSRPPPKLPRKKPQRQRSQQPDVTPVTQPKHRDRDRDRDREQEHYPLHPHDSKPTPEQQDRPRRSQAPASQRTGPLTWLIAAFCAIFWIVIFLGGLIVLIMYLVYRPRSPRFEVSSATLNAAYVDAGALLNADLSVLTNFTNPNKKAGVEFSNMIIDLYYGNTLIATQYIESFSVPKAHSMFANVHMVTSQVRLPSGEITRLQEETSRNAIIFNIKGIFRVRSNLGSFLRYSYRLYSHCTIMMSAPPSGVLRATRCRTKR